MSEHRLCDNCLDDGAKGFPVGHDKGTQRDPYRDHVTLCEPCRDALVAGAFGALHARFRAERTVTRGGS